MKHVSKAFTRETVYLDGQEFIDCEFRLCLFVYSGGPIPDFEGSNMEDCSWRLEGAALRTFQLLKVIYTSGGQNLILDALGNEKS